MVRLMAFPERSDRIGAWRDSASWARCSYSAVRVRNADKEAAAWAELRREDADARAIPDLVDLVEQVHDIEPQRRRLVRRDNVEIVRQPDIDLGVRWQVIDIGKAGAKSAAVDHRRGKARAHPEI